MLTSIRSRLIVGTIGGTLILCAVAAAILYGAIRKSLLDEFDLALETKLQTLVGLTEQRARSVRVDLDPGQDVEFGQGRREAAFVLIGHDGRIILSSRPLDALEWWKTADTSRAIGFLSLPTGTRGRAAVSRFQPRPDESDFAARDVPREAVTWIVWASTREIDGKLERLLWLLAGTFALTTLVSAGVLAAVIRRGLHPMEKLAASIQGIGNDPLTPVDIGPAPDEIRPVVERLNELLARLQASFSRERAFTADVAHEFRTPLAGLTMALEVSLTRTRESAEYQQTMQQCLAASRSMRSLVENLLTLARADARQISARREEIDLPALLRRTWEPFESAAAGRKLSVQWQVDAAARLDSDPGLLVMIISNLFDNAVSYAREGAAIEVNVAQDDAGVRLRISNSGSEVNDVDAVRVFDRFWRADAARTGGGQHFGLGLALCQRIQSLLGGTIQVSSVRGHQFVVELFWPRRR